MNELSIERHLVAMAKRHGGMALKSECMVAGFPDRVLLFPWRWPVFVELKAPGKKPRKLQRHWLDRLTLMGFEAVVIDSKEQVDALFQAIRDAGADDPCDCQES